MAKEHDCIEGICLNCGMVHPDIQDLPQCSDLATAHVKWIDQATIKEMENRANTMHPGDTIFIGNMGRYFLKRMNEKREDY